MAGRDSARKKLLRSGPRVVYANISQVLVSDLCTSVAVMRGHGEYLVTLAGPGASFGGAAVHQHTIIVTTESAVVLELSKRVVKAAMGQGVLSKLTALSDVLNSWRRRLGDRHSAELAGECEDMSCMR